MSVPTTYVYWIDHSVALGYLIGWYLWLISLAEGTHIVAHLSWLYYRTEDYRPLEKVGTFQPFIILALVPLFLVADLGHPERFYTMFYHWHWTSPVAYGVYIITLCMLSYAVHSYYLFRPELMVKAREKGPFQGIYRLLVFGRPEEGDAARIRRGQERRERFWAGVSLFFSFMGLIYLGILLSSFKGRVMWHSSVMVFIFFAFGACSGSAFLILLTHLKNALVHSPEKAVREQQRYLSEFGIILKYSLVAQAGVLFVYFVLLHYTGIGGRAAAKVFFVGPRAFQFWFFQVAVGLVLPFLLMLYRRMRENVAVSCIAAVAAMVGTLFGCLNIFIGGQMLPMTHFDWEPFHPEPGKMAMGIVVMCAMFFIFLVTYKVLPYENIEA
ncbi:Formate-dependent nitrite reductase, membrane component NrfD [Desulfacinum infernum DSM 9756]|uniref:Formate-dependent nitrite reductase, membrane component NrfD n=1 Tax=Desulfacinum infernum DSM 9756 TaxID=1121391 RepID=A0A1M5IQD3_9BACT|nr:NrfD/PsrC family molybdoenzyme membrane anchor subunit [Desulfacinum infernum]SHG30517.1 Formate-dependent nitrite reductase, membrane component NrfD [Desulfacinum infernum DSM 9756]